ncbi:putative membrane protein [Dongia mobilis]|uniref:Putative membrane protein n=1 Tax=Dongia mobilis TaxID=578943 RepID=A0A4R6WVQ1_9PROT|nr:TPM domain-containing protein [Dongia mobilis]TDQ81328.1 putative membrane protein [Dongia mobilis]
MSRIETAIGAVEARSRAELVAVLAPRASEYRGTGLALSALLALLAGILAWYLLPWADGGDVLLAELVVFPLTLALLELTPLGDRLTLRPLKAEAAARLARASFLDLGLAGTPERNAVLFFVSLAEHHVEIIADVAIHSRVGTAAWQRIVDAFAADVRSGRLEEGFAVAIAAIGDRLAEQFPADGERRNEISNRFIVLA